MNEQWNTRQSLLIRASDPSDHTAFEEFVSYYSTFIQMILAKLNVHSEDRKDLEQNLLLKLWKDLSKFDQNHTNSTFRGWLRKVIRNDVYKYYNKNKKRAEVASLLKSLEDGVGESKIDKMIEEEWKAHVVNLAVKKVKEHFDGNAFKIFELTLDGKSATEISHELDMKENSVYVLRTRVKARFQKEIRNIRSLLEFE